VESGEEKSSLVYRYGARLGAFLIELDNGKTISVGGGYSNKQRAIYWKNREKLIGLYVDFVEQHDPKKVATGRFNRFVRFREDL